MSLQEPATPGQILDDNVALRRARLLQGLEKIIPKASEGDSSLDFLLDDKQCHYITGWCESNTFGEWAKRPRTLVVLYMIACTDAMDSFVAQGLSDIALPYSEENLPRAVRGSKRTQFVALQHKVLAQQASNLEHPGSPHCNINVNADMYFHLHRELGSGGFGTVDHVFSRLSLKPYARKRIPRGRSFKKDQDTILMFENELQHLKALSHRHLVKLIGSYTDRLFVGLIMTPVADMDLQRYLTAPLEDFPDRSFKLRRFFGCLATSVEYLHQHKIRHKDIKPHNILLKQGKVLLTDFGTSGSWDDDRYGTTIGTNKQAFTKAYCAPEVAQHETRNASADIWSLGCVFLDICTVLSGQTLAQMRAYFAKNGTNGTYIRDNQDGCVLWIKSLKSSTIDDDDHQVLDLVPIMCNLSQSNRPTATELVSLILEFEGQMYYDFCCDRNHDNQDEVTAYDTSVAPALVHPTREQPDIKTAFLVPKHGRPGRSDREAGLNRNAVPHGEETVRRSSRRRSPEDSAGADVSRSSGDKIGQDILEPQVKASGTVPQGPDSAVPKVPKGLVANLRSAFSEPESDLRFDSGTRLRTMPIIPDPQSESRSNDKMTVRTRIPVPDSQPETVSNDDVPVTIETPVLEPAKNEMYIARSAALKYLGTRMIALYNFDAGEPNELSFQTDEILKITEITYSRWWMAINEAGKTGLVPENYLSEFESISVEHPAPSNQVDNEVISIIVEQSANRTRTFLNIFRSDTVNQLKNYIEARESFPHKQQQLTFRGHFLEDDKTIDSYRIESGNIIALHRNSSGTVYASFLIRIVEFPKRDTHLPRIDDGEFKLKVWPHTTIQNIKNKISQRYGYNPVEQILTSPGPKGPELDVSLRVMDYGLVEKSVVYLRLKVPEYEAYQQPLDITYR